MHLISLIFQIISVGTNVVWFCGLFGECVEMFMLFVKVALEHCAPRVHSITAIKILQFLKIMFYVTKVSN